MLDLHLQDGVGSATVCISSSSSTCSALETSPYIPHNFFNISNRFLSEANYIHMLLSVFSANHFFFIVQEIVKLATVDLVE